MPRAATIENLPQAFRLMKATQLQGIEWGDLKLPVNVFWIAGSSIDLFPLS